MSFLKQDLQQSLLKGYISNINESKPELLPEFLINDTTQHRKVLTTIIRELQYCEEFWFSVAFITTSGVAALMNTLLELKERSIKGKILVSKYLNFSQPLALERLLNNFPNIELRIAEHGDFHAKSYLFRKGKSYNLIVGSSNMTSAALCKNKEWNLKITALKNSYIMRNALKEFQSEFQKGTPVTEKWLLSYALIYEKVNFFSKNIEETRKQIQEIHPNTMQQDALKNLEKLRKKKL
jgi:HKD family nuclease